MSPLLKAILLCGPASVSPYAFAQNAPPAPPASASAAAPYRSAFEAYQPFKADEVQDWRRSNDTVREAGGWRAYAREISGAAAEPRAPAPAAGTGTAAPRDPHAGHHP
ncbi:hypothetical protein JI739_13030 [Ramlibacter sp. AW1]|uniref:Uncharacterized protein n=1 Tax=Ramlibacter aurantiacus TaxID=2801330 RepID=A0A936ZPB3_9BURK|nr:hypothetical protein [Ramlibacter aurantiacus]MBL0421276.1 hypothetical protein [Ramlibacter aurantiacus]